MQSGHMKGRQRGRNGGKPRPHQGGGGGGHRNPNFDPNYGRMRGNAQQLMDKYLAMARDATMQGDRVAAENFFQHADHYYRVINARFEGQQQGQGNNPNNQNPQNNQNQNQNYNNQRNYNQGGYDRSYEGGQPGGAAYTEQGRVDIPPPATAGQPIAPIQQNGQYAGNAPQPDTDSDIGLPPGLFGGAQPQPQPEPAMAEAQPAAQEQGGEGGEDRNFRPRHQGRRRRFPREGQQSQGDQS